MSDSGTHVAIQIGRRPTEGSQQMQTQRQTETHHLNDGKWKKDAGPCDFRSGHCFLSFVSAGVRERCPILLFEIF